MPAESTAYAMDSSGKGRAKGINARLMPFAAFFNVSLNMARLQRHVQVKAFGDKRKNLATEQMKNAMQAACRLYFHLFSGHKSIQTR